MFFFVAYVCENLYKQLSCAYCGNLNVNGK